MTAKRVREDVDEEEDRQTKHRPDAIPEASTDTGKSKGKGAKGGKGKGLNPADRKCFLFGEERHYKAQCSPKMVRPKECIWQLVEQLTILVR